jgi:hypothetical protein
VVFTCDSTTITGQILPFLFSEWAMLHNIFYMVVVKMNHRQKCCIFFDNNDKKKSKAIPLTGRDAHRVVRRRGSQIF